MQIKNAIISVSNKAGIVEFAKHLQALKINVYSSGGTCRLLRENNIAATEIASYTKFPEMMGGRIKTLHPKIHGGILARRDTDAQDLIEHNIVAFDLVVVNLYPFVATINKADCSYAEAVENIDIGGPTMLRSAAKNHKDVAVVVDTNDYRQLIEKIAAGTIDFDYRKLLAFKAFNHTADYDTSIQNYLAKQLDIKFPQQLQLSFSKKQNLRYGENPHQSAAFYSNDDTQIFAISNCRQLQGKELSFNNIADADAAINCLSQFANTTPACVIVKHANPCGVAIGNNSDTIISVYQRAYAIDTESAFGGIIAINQTVESELASTIINTQFAEVIIAPTFSKQALQILSAKKNIRILESANAIEHNTNKQLLYKSVRGGLLVQNYDDLIIDVTKAEVVTNVKPSVAQLADLDFAWKVAKSVKSNAIVYAKNLSVIGIGAGQMSRVNSARIAIEKAKQANLEIAGSVMASDAFLPFRDSVDTAANNNIKCIVQPGGSRNDAKVIAAANDNNIAMVFTKTRHFYH